MSRKLLVSAGAVFCLLVAALFWQMNTFTTNAQEIGGFEGSLFRVNFAPGFDFHAKLGSLTDGQTFIVEAPIVSDDAMEKPLGTLYRVGTRINDHVAVVQDVYAMDECGGRIMAQGILKSPSPLGRTLLAVTGGTGVYRSIQGELQIKILDESTGRFRGKVQEARRRFGEEFR